MGLNSVLTLSLPQAPVSGSTCFPRCTQDVARGSDIIITMNIWAILKSLKKNCLVKKSFIVFWQRISDKEYEHVLNVWNKFEMKTMKDYYDLYLKFDVLLLADLFEKFRNNSLKDYGLFWSHYLSAPGLSLDAILKIAKSELELIPDLDMYIFFRKGTREIPYISNRYSKANNKYLKSYDLKQESKHIIYLDANDLYIYAMYQFLPTSRFKWIRPKEFDLHKYTSNSSKDCVLEADLEYPKELRELNNDYSSALDKIEIKEELLSQYQ